jgi:uncharacterized DUF497 family protein
VQRFVVEFEWDPHKSVLNKEKHGIGFPEARALWNDTGLVLLPSRFPDEPCYLALAKIGQTHWTAIITERGESIRIISVRRSRPNEQILYEQNQPSES